MTWKAVSEAFGKTILEPTNKITMNLRFPGQYYDQETGTHYNYFRDYNPNLGRYNESDPIGLEGGINTFLYVGGNPTRWQDPTGQNVAVLPVVVGVGVVIVVWAYFVGQKAAQNVGSNSNDFSNDLGYPSNGTIHLPPIVANGDIPSGNECYDTNITGGVGSGSSMPPDDDQDKGGNKRDNGGAKDYKGNLNPGDRVDLGKFTNRQSSSGGKASYVDPKTGWRISPDRAGANSHGGSAWKLLDKKGNRILTLDKLGNVLRK